MADRLQELLQQRALIKEHLEWLDAEIAASSGRPIAANSPTTETRSVTPLVARHEPAPLPTLLPTALQNAPVVRNAAPDEADLLIAKLAAEERAAPVPSKQGCWLVFWIMLATIVGGVFAVWYFFLR